MASPVPPSLPSTRRPGGSGTRTRDRSLSSTRGVETQRITETEHHRAVSRGGRQQYSKEVKDVLNSMRAFGYEPEGSHRFVTFIQHQHCEKLLARCEEYSRLYLRRLFATRHEDVPEDSQDRSEVDAWRTLGPPTEPEMRRALKALGWSYLDVVMDFGDFVQTNEDTVFFELLIVFLCFRMQATIRPDEKEKVNLQLEIGNVFRTRLFNRTALNTARREMTGQVDKTMQLQRDEKVPAERVSGYQNYMLKQAQPPTTVDKAPHSRISSLQVAFAARSPPVSSLFPTIRDKMATLKLQAHAAKRRSSRRVGSLTSRPTAPSSRVMTSLRPKTERKLSTILAGEESETVSAAKQSEQALSMLELNSLEFDAGTSTSAAQLEPLVVRMVANLELPEAVGFSGNRFASFVRSVREAHGVLGNRTTTGRLP
eukprot:TRINITY_DN22004_c0_g1_i1.p1 TRINITY_DN22004_c0_g1~~TRINITY_DN22004_c0_g1_i1.p1  ORF type:complete len:426 (-),score=77.72 TRINITY_DN22004_c0_g1_i1:234-1511(-)